MFKIYVQFKINIPLSEESSTIVMERRVNLMSSIPFNSFIFTSMGIVGRMVRDAGTLSSPTTFTSTGRED